MTEREQLLTAAQAWPMCSPATVRRLTKAGRLPAPVRIGRKVLWRESIVAAVHAGTWRPAT